MLVAATVLLMAAGCNMAQTTISADPDFVGPLKASATGIFFSSVAGFTPEKIEWEFRKAVQDPALVADEKFMANLMFLVRKREVRSLLPDVEAVLSRGLQPRAEVSALKTLFALGSTREHAMVDDRVSRELHKQIQSGADLSLSPFFESSERIGGPQTLRVLQERHGSVLAEQRHAEQAMPNDHVRIKRLDQLRSELDDKTFILSRKLVILAMPEEQLAGEMVGLYLQRSGQLSFWAYKELVDHPTAAIVNGVRAFITQKSDSLLPVGGLSEEQRSAKRLEYWL